MPKQGAERRVKGGGGRPSPLRTVDSSYRNSLTNQIDGIKRGLGTHLKQVGMVPVQVSLISEALAKSHRPNQLFSEKTCPIIGNGSLCQIFIKATSDGLDKLSEQIQNGFSEKIVKEISCIQSIEPITKSFRLRGLESDQILKLCPRGQNGFLSQVRLFDFGDSAHQSVMVDEFLQVCEENRIIVSQIGYSRKSFVYIAECNHVDNITALSNSVSVRSISSMPLVSIMQPKVFNEEPMPNLKMSEESGDDLQLLWSLTAEYLTSFRN